MGRHGDRFSLADAFRCAGAGVADTLRHERNMKIHACAAVLAVAFCFALPVAPWGLPCVVLCVGAVMALECVNTAVEAVVDLVSPEWHPLAKRAKDAAAGAALIAAAMSVVVGLAVYVPAVVSLLGR